MCTRIQRLQAAAAAAAAVAAEDEVEDDVEDDAEDEDEKDDDPKVIPAWNIHPRMQANEQLLFALLIPTALRESLVHPRAMHQERSRQLIGCVDSTLPQGYCPRSRISRR